MEIQTVKRVVTSSWQPCVRQRHFPISNYRHHAHFFVNSTLTYIFLLVWIYLAYEYSCCGHVRRTVLHESDLIFLQDAERRKAQAYHKLDKDPTSVVKRFIDLCKGRSFYKTIADGSVTFLVVMVNKQFS